ncbi:restriction endonuclease subunit S [Desulfobacter postgatei]|uniref:restriction endonuclease subunit S n=1 Tax=Desulfobacter postgatei TaxID=2293 RepID=UPI00259B4078|nr:restriction endonuclease subunit S [uncultured Desulfobacter sp.]
MKRTELLLKQARISLIPDKWSIARVGDCCSIRNDLRKPLSINERSLIQGEYPYYGPTGVLDYLNEFLVEGEFALIGEDGDHFLKPNEKPQTIFAQGRFNVNNHAHLIESTGNCSSQWFAVFFKHRNITNFLSRQGANRYKLNKATLEKLPLLLPPIPEQKAIADLLSTWDEAIGKTERLIRAKERQKIGELHSRISCQKANSTIGSFAKQVIRKVDKPDESYVALGIRSHFKGTFQRLVEDPKTVNMDSLYRVKENDLIVNITFAWEGAIALVKTEDEECYVSHRFPTYVIRRSKAEPYFIRQLIMSSRMKYDLSNISPGGAGRNRVLNKKDFLKMPIWLPELKTQKDIGEYLGAIDNEIDLLKQLAEKYKTQKRGLMQKMLTGEWRIAPDVAKTYEEM